MVTNYFSQWQNFETNVTTWQHDWIEPRKIPRQKMTQHINSNCKTVLDVGCGIANNHNNYTTKYVGIDVTPKFAKEAHQKGADILNASGLNIPFKDNSFDCVCCENVLVHMPPNKWKTFLKEMIRVASKFVVTLDHVWNWEDNATTVYKIGEVYGENKFYWNRYCASDVQEVFESKGMTGSALVNIKEDWQLTIYKK